MARALMFAVFLLGGLSQPAMAAFTSLYVFGDSLADSGNAFILSGGWPPSPPYAQRLSNGPVSVERLAENLGVPLAPAAAGGTNYAVGGATTDTRNFSYEVQFPFAPVPDTLATTGLRAQIDSFASSAPSFDPGTSLFVVWAGPNDFFLAFEQGTDPVAALMSAVSNIAASIETLIGLGATHLLVPNMPNLGATPFAHSEGPEVQAALAGLTSQFNAALDQTLDQIRAASGVNLMEFDVAALLEQVIADPAAFGFSDVTTACLNVLDLSQVLSGCPGFLFFDLVHPSAAAHRLLGNMFFARVTQTQPLPEPSSLALLAVSLLAAFAAARRAQPLRRERTLRPQA